MKRICAFSLIISYFISGVQAVPISSADALGVARSFLAARGIETSSILNVTIGTRATEPQITGDPNPPYYLFNIGKNDGFIIVAGDDRVSPVLGYSPEGRISPETMPEACIAWLEATANAISDIPDSSIRKPVAYPDFTVEPLLKSRWDQSDPYNRKCPIDKSTGIRTATGCVATAAAQVMYYYQYPTQPTGKVEYEDKLQNEHRTFDFSAMSPIDWDNISDTYTSEASDKESDAVAELMNAVAHGSRMQFRSETSMAYNYNAGHALIDFFGYDPNMHYYERVLVSDEEWISIITSELKAGRPVLYEGANQSMGHAFVCDGYDGNGFFHINWGWNGLSDGYFSIATLNPQKQSTGGSESGYALRQTILCNIAPKDTPGLLPQESGLLNIDKLYFRNSSDFHNAADNAYVTSSLADAQIFFYSFNKGLKNFNGQMCMAVADGDDIHPLSTISIENLGSQNYTAVRFPFSDTSIPEGNYKIGFYYRTSPAGKWHPVLSSTPGAPSLCNINIAGRQVTMSAILPDIMPEMVETLRHSRLFLNSTSLMSFELVNSGSSRLEAYSGIAILDAEGKYLAVHSIPVVCPPHDKMTVEIETPIHGLPTGECFLMPFYSYNSKPEASDILPLTLNPFHAVVECAVLTPDNGSYFMIDSDKTHLDLSVTNLLPIEWRAPIAVEILSLDGVSLVQLPDTKLTVGPSAIASLRFDCSSLSLSKGSYKARFFIADENPILLAEFPLVALTDIASVSMVEADNIRVSISDVIYVSSPEILLSCTLYEASGCVVSDTNPLDRQAVIHAYPLPHGIYFLRIVTESGKTVTRKIKL